MTRSLSLSHLFCLLYLLPAHLLLTQPILVQPADAQNHMVYESGGELIPGYAVYDVGFYDLDLKINPADSSIEGSVTTHATIVHPTDHIVLDLDPRFSIHSIRLLQGGEGSDRGEVSESRQDEELEFDRPGSDKHTRVMFSETKQPGEKVEVEIRYSGKPLIAANPPWDGGFVWERTAEGEPWIGVAVQTVGAWTWWPNKDHPSDKADSLSLTFTLPEGLTVASNGVFRNTTVREEGWRSWHWFSSYPINNYNVTLNAAPYEVISDSYESVTGEKMEILFWVLPEAVERGMELFPQFARQLRFLEELIGPYPFRGDKYGVAHAPYLGMEHQTLIAYGASFENNNLYGVDIGFDDLHQHELSHEWWGNLVTAWDWKDFWIHEGFGTYMQALYAEYLGGEGPYNELMAYFRRQIRSLKEVAPRKSQTTVDVSGSGRGGDIYYKGAWFLHTLRYLMGDEPFFTLLRRFAYPDGSVASGKDDAGRFVTTDDFLTLASEVHGESVEWLFEHYLRQAELPVLVAQREESTLSLHWETVGVKSFPMPVELNLDGKRQVVTPGREGVSVEVSDNVQVELDPDRRILMEVIQEGSN